MGKQSPYRSGKLFGFFYDFAKAGDGIAMHQHEPDKAHNVIVLRGSVSIAGAVLEAGHVHDFDNSAPHEIKALEDDTQILNLMLNGMPPEYTTLPEKEFFGETRTPT